ncbi:MAG: PEPxxWA-CTERM sorting domain-containing protein [Chakrabartia sp.]
MKYPIKPILSAILCAAAALVATPASAVVIYLTASPVAVPGGWEFSYQGNFSSGEGIKTGSTLVIFDFAGYIPGSVFSPYADIAAAAELVSAGVPTNPDFTDDPALYNLRFTYTGAPTLDLSNTNFSGLTAISALNGVTTDGFSAVTVKTSGALAGRNVYSSGQVEVPAAVPEPAVWAMLLAGFGLAGVALRRRRQPVLLMA